MQIFVVYKKGNKGNKDTVAFSLSNEQITLRRRGDICLYEHCIRLEVCLWFEVDIYSVEGGSG
jgi:hypothetical protein